MRDDAEMIHWIRRSARLTAGLVFFAAFLCGLDYARPFESALLIRAFVKAFGCAATAWFAVFVVADIVYKGVVEDIDAASVDVMEDGILQRVREQRLRESAESTPLEEGKSESKRMSGATNPGRDSHV